MADVLNIREDPQELNDRAKGPGAQRIAASMLAQTYDRWSAPAMLEGLARETARREVSCPVS